jgi:hypothetical protein
MANFGRGLTQGFTAGLAIGEALRQRRMREQFEEAQKEKAFAKYTPEQGEQMRREAEMVDEFGRPIYEFSIAPGSTTYTRRELAYPGGYSTGLGPTPESEAAFTPAAPTMESRESMGTTYRVPSVSDMYSSQPYERDITGETYYRPSEARVSAVDDNGFRMLSQEEARKVYAHPDYNPAFSANAQFDRLFSSGGAQRGLTAEERNYSPDLAATTPTSREVATRLGLTPREYGESMTYRPGAAEYLGKTYAEMPTEAQQRSGLMNRYAQILSEYDPIEGERFRSMARAEDRAQETFDLNKQLSQLQINQIARTDKEAKQLEDIYTAASSFQAENPNASPAQVVDHVRKTVKPSEATLSKFIASVVGVDQNNMTLMKNEVIRAIDRTKGSLPALIDVFNNDDRFDPSTNIVKTVEKDGKITIKMVSAADPSKVLSSQTFNSESEAFGDLAKRATDPVNYAGWALDMQYKQSQIAANEGLGAYRKFKAAGGGVRPERDYSVSDAARVSTALTGQRNSILRQIADQDEIINGMGTKEEKDRAKKVRQALAGQVDALDAEIAEVNSQLRGGLSRRGGGGGGGGQFKIGDVSEATTADGKKVQVRLVRGDGRRREDWEIIEPKTEPTKAEPKAEPKAAPAKTETKPAPKAARVEITKELQAKIDKENLEMGEGKRMRYSPDVAAAVRQIEEDKNEEQRRRREEAGRREAARAKQQLGL